MDEKINILNELKELDAVNLIKTGNKNYFSSPDNYFNDLADNVLAHVFIKSISNKNPYSVPHNYFENLAENILANIQVKNFETSNNFKQAVYFVPEGYFENLAGNILSKIKNSPANSVQQELKELSPLLSSIPKTNVYTVPENYFETLQIAAIKENVQPAAKVILIGSKTRKWLNYAAAACIAAVLFGGGYLYFAKEKPLVPGVSIYNPPLATVDVQKEISGLSDDEINNYLKDHNNTAVYTNVADDNNSENMDILQSLLQNVSDEEIQQYLNQNPEAGKKGGGI